MIQVMFGLNAFLNLIQISINFIVDQFSCDENDLH